jgi:hypothetical protein
MSKRYWYQYLEGGAKLGRSNRTTEGWGGGEGMKMEQTFLSIQIVWLNIEIVALGND